MCEKFKETETCSHIRMVLCKMNLKAIECYETVLQSCFAWHGDKDARTEGPRRRPNSIPPNWERDRTPADLM